MRIASLLALAVALTVPITSAAIAADAQAAFEPAPGVAAPPGYVAYTVRLWGASISGRFAEVRTNEDGGLNFRTETGGDYAQIRPATVDAPVQSVVFLPQAFHPGADVLALRVRRPADFHLSSEGPAPFTLRLIGPDPSDPAYRLYETYFRGRVMSGSLDRFDLDDAAVAKGYPYRGPITFHGDEIAMRPSRYAGEKSIIRIPISTAIPDILLYRP